MRTLLEILHKMAAHPWVYDRIQSVAGQQVSLERIQKSVSCSIGEAVVDVGGGTGATRNVWPEGCLYVCLDIEMPKLKGFRSKHTNGLGVLGDATRMPFADGCVDIVVCMAVLHHLTDRMVDQLVEEALRILKPGGRVIWLDPVLNPKRWVGLLLWKMDRGSNPRTAIELKNRLAARFEIMHWESYAVYHEYVLGIGVKRRT